MAVRVLLIAAALLLAVAFYRRVVAPRVAADPRLRQMLSGVGLRLLLITLLRTGLPMLLRAVRALRFFR